MSVVVKKLREYDKAALMAIIESCGGCPPPEPQCLPCSSPISTQPTNRSIACPPVLCTCLTGLPVPSCPPCCDVCPPLDHRPVVRTPMNTGGLFYNGTIICNPGTPPA